MSGDWSVGIARMGSDRVRRIYCREYWIYDSQPLRRAEICGASGCAVNLLPFAGGDDGRLDVGILAATSSEAGFWRGDRATGALNGRLIRSI